MILHLSPGTPWPLRAAAATVLTLHIGAGIAGLIAGFVAILARKGGALHRRSGTVFFAAMLVMTGIGTCVAPLLPQQGSVVMGAFSFYLVITGWITIRRAAGRTGTAEILACIGALAIAFLAVAYGLQAAGRPSHTLDGSPPLGFYGFAAIVALSGLADLRVIRRGGIAGAPRLLRHLWRMCTAFLIADFSFFLGQQRVFPPPLRGSPLLFVPVLAVLGLTIFWVARMRRAVRAARAGAAIPHRGERTA